MFDLILYATILAPLLAAAVIALNLLGGEEHMDWRQIQRVATTTLLISMLGSLFVFIAILIDPTPREVTAYTWFTMGDTTVEIGFLVDSLSSLMALMITGFSFLIAVFSVNYMHNDPSFSRYFSAMLLFVFAMLILVLGDNFIMLFVGWESVGLCSYLLIGHFYERSSAAAAGTKAFVMNRVGDAGFLAGIFLIVQNFGTVKYTEVFANLSQIDEMTATGIGICLLAGAIGKSAQFPLGTWLARAMEGPTPSSALIHAATMVTAGIYLIVRCHELYDMAPIALATVTIIGALTAVYGTLTGLTNTDIKGILASSTVTQLGLMFVACGLGAYPVAVFHLVAHAFLKTFLFLTAPSILNYFHNLPDPNARATGSVQAPVAFWFVLIGSIGLIGAGFGLNVFGETTGLTPSFYLLSGLLLMGMFATIRHAVSATQRIFAGHDHDHHHAHDHGGGCGHDHSHDHSRASSSIAPVLTPVVLIVMGALLAFFIGLLPGGLSDSWFQAYLEPVVNLSPLADGGTVMSWVVIAALGGLLLVAWASAVHTERFESEVPGDGLTRTRAIYVAAQKRFWLDDLYHKFIVGRAVRMGQRLDTFDRETIDWVTGTPEPEPRSVRVDAAWEEGFLKARAEGLVDVLGDRSAEEAGILARLQALGASESPARFEPVNPGVRGSGLFGGIAAIASRVSGWVETTIFDRLHGGVARSGGSFGALLFRLEELFGRPITLCITIVFVVVAIIVGVMS